MTTEFWVARASTAWRGWDAWEYDGAPECVEVSLRDCAVGTLEVLQTGDYSTLASLVRFAATYAENHDLPLVWTMQDLCYAEPCTADEMRAWAARAIELNTVHCSQCGDRIDADDAWRLVDVEDEAFCGSSCGETYYYAWYGPDMEDA